MKPIKLKDLLMEDVGGQIDKRQYLSDVQNVTQAVNHLQDSLMALEAGNYHPDRQHAQQVITSLRERADAIKRLLKTAYLDKYYNK